MPSSCLALLLSLTTGCTLPWSPLQIRVTLAPEAPDVCLQYAQNAPLCASAMIAAFDVYGSPRP
ncbi:hypothetical protein ABE473_11770 [Stenotrophomonas sp. TWI700]|uniref:hypothetical protein n=1 Tax=Stenotrophomonas sp. TWI700 TaxID=3136792 RepID=UPI00320A260A